MTKEILKLQYNFFYLPLSKWGRNLHHGINSHREEGVKILLFLQNDLSAAVFAGLRIIIWLQTCCLKYTEPKMSRKPNFWTYTIKLLQSPSLPCFYLIFESKCCQCFSISPHNFPNIYIVYSLNWSKWF